MIHSYDFKDEAVTAEANRVLSIVDNCIQKGLKWSVMRCDINEKMEYVMGACGVYYAQTALKQFETALFFLYTHDAVKDVLENGVCES